MNPVNVTAIPKATRGGTFWAFVPLVLLAAMVGGLLLMASIASNDPGFALERDYYQKALHYDGTIAQRGQNQRLGWNALIRAQPLEASGTAGVSLEIQDRAGKPLTGARVRVETFANAHASNVRSFTLSESAPGVYQFALDHARSGLWELRVDVLRGAEHFTTRAKIELGARSSQSLGASE